MKLGKQVGLGPGQIVLDGDPAPPQKGYSPQFSAHVYCGQTARWINMPLGTEVGLGPGDFVLHGYPGSTPKGGTAPNFRPMSIVAKRLDGSRCHLVGVCLGSGDTVLDGDRAPRKKGHSSQFSTMSIVAKRLGASVYHLNGGRPRPRQHCVRWRPSAAPPKAARPPIFGPCLL